jgi:hypothetical protein
MYYWMRAEELALRLDVMWIAEDRTDRNFRLLPDLPWSIQPES